MSSRNFVLSWVEHEKSLITSGPGFLATHRAPIQYWPDCADVQADLSVQWEHMPTCTFCWTPAQIINVLIGQKLCFINPIAHKVAKTMEFSNMGCNRVKLHIVSIEVFRLNHFKYSEAIRTTLKPSIVKYIVANIVKNSEYDQKIPQSQTADQPMALQGRATQQSRDTRKTY